METSFLVPLIGGSGGGGGTGSSIFVNGNEVGGGGGGGAILIASSQNISLVGTITARGGAGGWSHPGGTPGAGGGGSSGGIRIVANDIQGTGKVLAEDTRNGFGTGNAPGRIRLEAFTNQFTGTINPTPTFGTPYNTFIPATPPPTLRAVTVDGNPVAAQPTGSFEFPDVSVNEAQAVSVEIAARNIPLGTIIKLNVLSESGPDQVIDSTPLAGALANSTATASVVLPPGLSRGFLRAMWTP